MHDKKVIVVIVEGPSDESAIGSILKEYFSSEQTYFVVTHGDITSRKDVTPSNAISKVKLAIEQEKGKYGYKWSVLSVLFILQIQTELLQKTVFVKSDVKGIQYFEDHMESDNVEDTKKRNIDKAAVILKLYSTSKIMQKEYQLYFNSCNLEHVLYNALKDFTDR